jgi:hypothetical protein
MKCQEIFPSISIEASEKNIYCIFFGSCENSGFLEDTNKIIKFSQIDSLLRIMRNAASPKTLN